MAAEERSEWFRESHPLFSINLRDNVYLIASCSALSPVLSLFLVFDFSVLDGISPFKDVRGWKLQRMGGGFWQSQKGISYSSKYLGIPTRPTLEVSRDERIMKISKQKIKLFNSFNLKYLEESKKI